MMLEDESESRCKYVCSRGLMKSCDIYSKSPRSSIRELVDYDFDWDEDDGVPTLYICSSAIPEFRKILHSISYKFILVSGDCDECCWTDLFESNFAFLMFVENPKIVHWFSQNCIDISHPKLSQMPIGLDYHTLAKGAHSWGPQASPVAQEKELLELVASEAKPWKDRQYKHVAYSNFHFLMTTRFAGDRHDALQCIPGDCVYYEPVQCPRIDSWRRQLEHVFIVSPHGGGLDCHRTWEALALGCIPIVKTSPLDPLFEGLPVWIVHNWSDVTKENMRNIIAKFSKRSEFQMERLELAYWVKKIKEKAET